MTGPSDPNTHAGRLERWLEDARAEHHRLLDVINAIDLLHQPQPSVLGVPHCPQCRCQWPCPTHKLIADSSPPTPQHPAAPS